MCVGILLPALTFPGPASLALVIRAYALLLVPIPENDRANPRLTLNLLEPYRAKSVHDFNIGT